MKKILISFALILTLTASSEKLFAWGKIGHELVAQIAFHFLDDSTQKIVKGFLGDMSIEEASNWMDESKSNSYFDYMRTWHYINIDKGQKYAYTGEKNILTVLHSAITDLKQYKTLSKKDVKRDLLLIFHLMGDLHQPLHCGYGVDRGGNSIEVTSPFFSGNLHGIWDSQLLEYKKITLDSCLELYDTLDSNTVKDITQINELKWMYESRAYLDTAYSFQNNFLDTAYVDSNAQVIKRQLLIGGLRMAAVLKKLFGEAKQP
ncbi:MAG: S1/P1 nuclease [Chitinophagaceae bacterium]|nr:S1/P1 nuclease [Chitinophagaceae bacterium]